MPVLRPNGTNHKSAVVAHTKDLDAWLDSHWSQRNDGHAESLAGDLNPPASDLILSAREIRLAHSQLIHETTAAMRALINSCQELALTRASLHRPPPLSKFLSGEKAAPSDSPGC
jgi:hypothetical protein